MPGPVFHFKQFRVRQDRCALKVGTDGLLLGGWTDWSGVERVLDIGTGTGVLAPIAAQRAPRPRSMPWRWTPQSAAQAAENVAASPWPDRVRVHAMDVRRLRSADPSTWWSATRPTTPGGGFPDERRNLARHHAGLTFAELLEVAGRVLAPEGRFSVVLPPRSGGRVPGLPRNTTCIPTGGAVFAMCPTGRPSACCSNYGAGTGPYKSRRSPWRAMVREGYDPAYQSLLSDLMTKF